MKRKKIALLLAQADENTQRRYTEGFLREAFARNYDVCIFSMFLKYQESTMREVGESNIYNLIQYDRFDAVVVMKDTIQTPGVAECIEERIKESFKGPVIVIDDESKYFRSIMMDHYTPIYRMVEHLIKEHGYKDIAFLNGRKNHIHSRQRLAGYVDSMTDHGLTVDENRIYDGTYWYNSGDDMVHELLKNRENLPDAIVCANDCMAIGIASLLSANGIRIPEDIAVVGYDSTEDGRKSPVPLTSAVIPAYECGEYTAELIDAIINGDPEPEFHVCAKPFISRSCGCEINRDFMVDVRRKAWDTDISSAGVNSCFNHMTEELISRDDYRDFFNVIFQYVYQIRDFDSFSMCLNSYWTDFETVTGDKALRYGYTKYMNRIIKCGADRFVGNSISFDEKFGTASMIPELDQERDKPAAFIFTPLYFNDRTFGYSVISYGNKARVYGSPYRVWMKNVMMCMEAFYRQASYIQRLGRYEAEQIRDALTGLYNYRGFLNQGAHVVKRAVYERKSIAITAVDISGLKKVNAIYGRKEGDEAIVTVSRVINDAVGARALCTRMCNDEFLVCSAIDSDKEYDHNIEKSISKGMDFLNKHSGKDYELSVFMYTKTAMVTEKAGFDHLVNDTVNEKNNQKQKLADRLKAEAGLTDEAIRNDRLVAEILDNNNMAYRFQPIVSAETGDIYAYEALMYVKGEVKLPTLAILESADRLGRLYDVERLTFFNILDYLDENLEQFGDAKIFVNSISGCQLDGEDREKLEQRLSKYEGRIVVELTEETEINDAELDSLKERYKRMNIDTAIDDYGAGYSNINNLLRYMPKYVKIDRMLMADIQDELQKRHFVKDIIEFAHDNDILALAEGVETVDELKEVIHLGADLIQGYYTCKPSATIVKAIDSRITKEIIQFGQGTIGKFKKKIYDVSDENVFSLIKLAINKYSDIVCGGADCDSRKIEILGSSGFKSNIVVKLKEGSCLTLVLNNASLAGEKGQACIDIGENSDVRLLLVGDNELRSGGICVPESSRLTIEGDGSLSINIDAGKYYGIGNSIDKHHGDIIFNQDGAIKCSANGMKGVCIGSGLGGNIRINRGSYDIEMRGQDGVAIGAIEGESDLRIEYCDLDIFFGVAGGTVIGSIANDAHIRMENDSVRIVTGGVSMTGIGTCSGSRAYVSMRNMSASIDMRSTEGCAIGGMRADTQVLIEYASVTVMAEGKSCFGLGNAIKTAYIQSSNSDLKVDVVNNTGMDVGAREEDIHILNGRAQFIVNDTEIKRQINAAEL